MNFSSGKGLFFNGVLLNLEKEECSYLFKRFEWKTF